MSDTDPPIHKSEVTAMQGEDAFFFAGITFRGTAREHLRLSLSGIKLVFPVNAELLIMADKDKSFRDVLSRHVSTFDGFWPYLIAKLRTRKRIEKLSGSEFVHDVFDCAAQERHKVFFLGTSPEMNMAAREVVKKQYGIEVEGYSPPFEQPLDSEEATNRILHEIRLSRPQILLVALGAPRQEFWLSAHEPELEALGVRFAMAVGGTLDMLAGVHRKAPKIICSVGLEGVWRTMLDPKRVKRFPNPIRFIRIIWRG
jgi:N-acetylglucosaminyldiphosphoundecaprenol N-acetyl-beta-D-mannosaminyltransferase